MSAAILLLGVGVWSPAENLFFLRRHRGGGQKEASQRKFLSEARQTRPPDYLRESELIERMDQHRIGTDASIPTRSEWEFQHPLLWTGPTSTPHPACFSRALIFCLYVQVFRQISFGAELLWSVGVGPPPPHLRGGGSTSSTGLSLQP